MQGLCTQQATTCSALTECYNKFASSNFIIRHADISCFMNHVRSVPDRPLPANSRMIPTCLKKTIGAGSTVNSAVSNSPALFEGDGRVLKEATGASRMWTAGCAGHAHRYSRRHDDMRHPHLVVAPVRRAAHCRTRFTLALVGGRFSHPGPPDTRPSTQEKPR